MSPTPVIRSPDGDGRAVEQAAASHSAGGGGDTSAASPTKQQQQQPRQQQQPSARRRRGDATVVSDGGAGRTRPSGKLPTLSEIKAAIPARCFVHSTAQALWLVLRDALVMVAILAVALATLRTHDLRVMDYAGWAVYGVCMGTAATGWWVLAHECGHGGFSEHPALNNAMGWMLHSVLLVPYFSWQYSHAKHHAHTNSLQDGETHNPNTRKELEDGGYFGLHRLLGDDGFAVFQLAAHLLLGWPVYLLTNATGARQFAHGPRKGEPLAGSGLVLDHFRPGSALFPPAWRRRVAVSTAGVVATLLGLGALGAYFNSAGMFGGRGHTVVALLYWPAYVVVNFWLVLYTWLQHTKEDVPHYGDGEWTWLKGALCTIDRPYSECFGLVDWMHHHIGSTHVFHHLFSSAPCYGAVEATRHLRAFLAPRGLYHYDGRPIWRAAWQTAKTCQFVDDVDGVQYMRSIAAGDGGSDSANPNTVAASKSSAGR